MSQITTNYSRSGYQKTDYGLTPASTLAGGVTTNAPNYAQIAGLRSDILSLGAAYTDLPLPYEDFSPIFEMMDTTEHNFFDMIPYGSRPEAVEFFYNHEELNSLEVPIKSGGALSILATAGKFGDLTDSGADKDTVLLSDVIDTTTQVGMKIRSGHVLRNSTSNSHELLLVMDLGTPTVGTGTLYICRGYNIGGRMVADNTSGSAIPVAATTLHAEGSTLTVAGLVTSENNLAPESFRTGYTKRQGMIQCVDFALSEGFFETLFTNKDVAPFNNPKAHAKDIHDMQFYEVWNNICLHSVPGRSRIGGFDFYSTAGVLYEIMRRCTAKWDTGVETGVGGYYDIQSDTTDVSKFVEYTCNGNSNFRVGTPGSVTTPKLFTETVVNDLNSYVIDKLGNNNKNTKYEPSVIIGPRSYRRLFGQFTQDRMIKNEQQNTMGGYFATSYLTDSGNVLKYVVDNTIGNAILIGNPAHGQKRSLVTMLKHLPVQQNRSITEWYTSIMGFQWDYPEYAWGYWKNLKAS